MNLPDKCYYCEREFSKPWLIKDWSKEKPLIRTKDHIIPTSKGGINQKRNYLYCCVKCNGLKANMTPEEFYEFLIHRNNKKDTKEYRELLEIITSNVKKLIATITPIRHTLIKGYQGNPPLSPKLNKGSKIYKLPPEKVVPRLSEEWQRQFQERQQAEK